MAQIISKISLNVDKPNLIQAIVAKQYDSKSRFLQVTLIHEGEKIEIAPTSTVTINAKRKDGSEKSFAGETNNDGTATVPLTYWMLEIEGEVWCDVSVVDTDGRKLSSTKFILEVEKASYSDSEISQDDNYGILVKLIEDVNKAKPDIKYDPTSENAQSGLAVAEALGCVANAIKQTVSGNPILIDDASPIKHTLDVKTTANETVYVRGKNLIPFNNKAYYNGRYAAGQTYVINGVSFTVNDDGSVYAKGTATGNTSFNLFSAGSFEPGVHTVTLSGSPNGSSATTYSLRLRNAEAASGVYSDYGNGVTINNTSITKATVAIIVNNGAIIDATFYPTLEFGTTASEFISPEETQSAIADENGIVSGIKLRKITSIFTETSAEIKCTYNKDTEKAIKDYVDTVIGGIENGSY